MLSEKLKAATQTAHQLLEKKLVQHLKSIQTKEEYAALLSLFYSFFGGMEASITRHLNIDFMPDYSQRRKAAALAEDITALHAPLPAVADAGATPAIASHLQAMGALYVMEGSTLGGQIICKMIRQKLALPEGFALSFFSGYGSNTETMWHIFKEAINQPLAPAEEAIVIQAANDTFIRFRQWFEQPLL